MRKTAQVIIGLVISLFALGLAFRGADPVQLANALRKANYFYLVPALGLIWLGLVARALSWRVILGGAVPFRRVYDVMNEGYLLNNLLPLRLGELGRAYLISRTTRLTASQALSSIVVERVIDLLMLVLLLAAFLPLVTGLGVARRVAAGAAFLGVVGLLALLTLARNPDLVHRIARDRLARWRWPRLRAERWERRIMSFLDGLSVLRDGRRALQAALWSGLAWVCSGLAAWLLLLGFVPEARPTMGFFVLTTVGLGNAIPSAPASAGVFEAVIVLALGLFAVERNVALSFALVFHLVHIGLVTLLGSLALANEGETLSQLARSAQALLNRPRGDSAAPAAKAADNSLQQQ